MDEKNWNKNADFICTADTCPVTLTTDVIGGKWKHLLIYMIYGGVKRFGAMQRVLPGISKNMLTQELRSLEANGIINRKIFPEIPPRVEYSLTDWGEKTIPILNAMAAWGAEFRTAVLEK